MPGLSSGGVLASEQPRMAIMQSVGAAVAPPPPPLPLAKYYTTSYGTSPVSLGIGERCASRFTCQEDFNCDYVVYCLEHFPVGANKTFRVGIQQDDGGGFPDGVYLTSADKFLTPGSYWWRSLTVPAVSLIKGRVYHVVYEAISGSGTWRTLHTIPRMTIYPYDSKEDLMLGYLYYRIGIGWTLHSELTDAFVIGDSVEAKYYGNPFFQSGIAPRVYGTRFLGEQWAQPKDMSVSKVNIFGRRRGDPPNDLLLSIWDKTAGEYVLEDHSLGAPGEIPTTYGWIAKAIPTINFLEGRSYQMFAKTVGGNSSNCYELRYGDCLSTSSIVRSLTWFGTLGVRAWSYAGGVPLEYTSEESDIAFYFEE